MWLSRDKDGSYCLHKHEPQWVEMQFHSDGEVVNEGYWADKNNQDYMIPSWVAVELCNKFDVCRPVIIDKINLPVHKARRYFYSWWLLLTREWDDLKQCLK